MSEQISITEKAPRAPRVVIIGRPNVGKSTLFNRLLGRRRALVHNEAGVTRDRLEQPATWWVRGCAFPVLLVDTGGLGGDRFVEEIKAQVKIALAEADVVVAVFDAQAGLTGGDEDLIRELKKSGVHKRVPVLGAVNKVDAEIHEGNESEFYALGLTSILTVSAEHGRGIDDLQEALARLTGFTDADIAARKERTTEEEELIVQQREEDQVTADAERSSVIRVAVVGRPNVGKSTLVNALLGQNRMITSPIAGTTVDQVDSLLTLNEKPFLFIDTAGIRRKSKTEQGIEVLSVVQTRKALERAQVALLLLDGESGITDQDEKIGGLIEESGCGVVLVVNKWDAQRKLQPDFTKEMAAEAIRKEMGYLKYAPILFISALKGQGLDDLGDLIAEIVFQSRLKIPTHEFTEWLRKEAAIHNPANAKFFLCHQTSRHPPTFVAHVCDPEKVHFSLRRHLVNALRERWGFMGSPLKLLFVEGKNRKSLPKPKKVPRKAPQPGAPKSSRSGKKSASATR